MICFRTNKLHEITFMQKGTTVFAEIDGLACLIHGVPFEVDEEKLMEKCKQVAKNEHIVFNTYLQHLDLESIRKEGSDATKQA